MTDFSVNTQQDSQLIPSDKKLLTHILLYSKNISSALYVGAYKRHDL